MLKVLVVQKIIHADNGRIEWRCCTDDGSVPDRFYPYPDENGDMTLMKVYPVWDVEGIETWAETQNAEEVEVWSSDDFQEQQMPKGVRWFIDLRQIAKDPKPSPKSLLKRKSASDDYLS